MRDGVVGCKLRPDIVAHDRDERTFVSHRVAIVRCREYGDAFSYKFNNQGMTSPSVTLATVVSQFVAFLLDLVAANHVVQIVERQKSFGYVRSELQA